jgi:hypothetical protein
VDLQLVYLSCKAYGQRGILMATKTSRFLEYMKLHLISLEQDLDKHRPEDTLLVEYIEGQIDATRHLLSVATDIMNSTNERYNNDNI